MTSVYKLRIHRWAERIEASMLSVMMAQEIAASADMTYELMLAVRKGDFERVLPARPDTHVWESLYTDHRRVTHGVFEAFSKKPGSGKTTQCLLDDTRYVSNATKRGELERFP